jgi:hypothetical protein
MRAHVVFSCSRCGERFSTSDELTAHLEQRHGNTSRRGGAAKRLHASAPPVVAASAARRGSLAAPSVGEDAAKRVSEGAPPVVAGSPVRRSGLAAPPVGDGKPQASLRAIWNPVTLLACAGLVAGAVTLSVAYSWAATHGAGQVQFHLFWAGEFLFLIPAIVRLLSRHASRAERLGLLLMIGLFSYLPKLLRDPSGPLFHDELVHWHQAQVIFGSGEVFVPNSIIGVIQFFPGLHLLTVELRHLTGLSTFLTGSILLAILHVVSLVGVFVVGERLTRSSWVAGLAALIYSLNPSFMFFNSQFAYESLAIVFLIWVIACVVGMQTARSQSGEKDAWFWIGLVLAAGCIVTHHLASYILVVALVVITSVTAARNATSWSDLSLDRSDSRRSLRLTSIFTILVLGGAAAWLILVASSTIVHLAPNFLGGLHQFIALLQHERQSRQLFAKSTLPSYEQLAALLTPVALALGTLGGLRLLWRNRRQAPAASIALGLFGLLYFAAVPLMLTRTGTEGARRTWAYSYLGLCLLIAPFLAAALARARGKPKHGMLTSLVVAVLGVVLIGNVAVQVNSVYMFPGPYVYGSDTRSLTPELLGLTQWFRATQGANQKVVADRYSALALANFGDAQTATPSVSFPIWQLYFLTGLPEPKLVSDLITSNYRFMVIDRRMSQYLSVVGVYFDPNEPSAYVRTSPPLAAALSKYEFLPWVIKIYTSDSLQVYRFDFADYRARSVVPHPVSGLAP